MSPRRFRQLAILTTVLLCLIVVAGGVVRLTGSGLGCDDWPACNDERFIDVSSGHAAIEQINRLFSGLIAIPVLAMAAGAFRVRPRRSGLVGPSIGVLVTVLANAVVGGMAVRGDLHPVLVQSHFLLAMLSIGLALLAVRRAGGREVAPVTARATRSMFWLVAVGTVVALATGTVVTGAGPHAGEEDVRRFGFDISDVARIHSVAVLVTVALAIGLVAVLSRDPAERARFDSAMTTWMFVAVVQGGIGYLQYFNGVPELLVGAHIAGATLLWVVTVLLVLAGLGTGVGDESRKADSGPTEAVPAHI